MSAEVALAIISILTIAYLIVGGLCTIRDMRRRPDEE